MSSANLRFCGKCYLSYDAGTVHVCTPRPPPPDWHAIAADLAAALDRFVTFHSGHVLPQDLVAQMTEARAALSRWEAAK